MISNEVLKPKRAACKPPRIFRTGALWALLLAVRLTAPANAAPRFWIDTNGGDWYDQQNWVDTFPPPVNAQPASVPGVGDVASFQIGGRTYTVTFSDEVDLTTLKIPNDRVTLDLEGRSLAASQVIHVGTVFNDIGSLTIHNGLVRSPVVFIAFDGGDGRLTVEDNALLLIDGSLSGIGLPFAVGGAPSLNGGQGQMELFGHLNVFDTDSFVGSRVFADGFATVSGGTWNTDDDLVFGHNGGAGHLLINNGGVVSAGGTTYVGQSGNAPLNETGVGEVDIADGTLTSTGTASIGSGALSFGDVDVVGADSAWNIGGFLFVAESGIGNLQVRDSASVHVQNDSFISVDTTEGLVNITSGGSFLNDGNMYVGGSSSAAGGPGELLVQSNGELEVGGLLKVWETGTLTLNGGTITTDNLMIQPGATVNFESGQLAIDSGALNIPLNFNFGGTDPFDPPEIILLNGALANVTDFSLGTTPGMFSSFEINGSRLDASDDINIGGNDSQSLGNGLLSLTGGFANAGNALRVWNNGEFDVNSGRVTAEVARLTGGSMSIAGLGASLHVDASSDFPLSLPGIHIGFAPTVTDLTIEAGASFSAPGIDFSVATDNSSFAFTTVTGSGSSLTTGETHVGNLGDGTINIFDSASATFTDELSIGFAPGSFGTLLIEGAGSKATSEGRTLVGRQGLGTLMMTLGGSFHSEGDTLIGALAAPINPAPGFVIVEDADWVSDQSIYLGGDENGAQAGGGQIFLQDDGTINNAGTMQVWSTGTLSLEGGNLRTRDLLFETGAGFDMFAGEVTVDGGLFRTPSSSLVFGGADPTNPVAFSFINGAHAQTQFAWHIGRNVDTFGETTVRGVADGVPSTLRGSGGGGGADLVVGLFGDGRLDVLDGGLVEFGDDVHIGSRDDATGIVKVSGVTPDGIRATIDATRNGGSAGISVGGQFDGGTLTGGTGELNIHDGGQVILGGDLFVGIRPLSTGALVMGGAEEGFESYFRVRDNVFLGSSDPSSSGSIEVQDNALLSIKNTLNLRGTGALIMHGGTLTTRSLHRTVPGGYDFERGTIRVDGGTLVMGGNTHTYGGPDSSDPPTYDFINGALFEIPSSFRIGFNPGTHAKTTVSGVVNGIPSTIRNVNAGGEIVVGESGHGILDVLDGALVDARSNLIIGTTSNGDGTLNVGGIADGFGATVRATRGGSTAAIIVGGKVGKMGGIGDLDVFDGGLVETSGDLIIAGNVQSRGNVSAFGRNGLVGEIRVGDDVFIGGNESAFGGRGEILLSGGGLLEVNDTLKVWPDGYIDMDEGTMRVNHLDLTDAEHGSVNFFLGRIEANQISGDLENFQGTLAPVKNGQGAVTLDGNYSQFSQAVLEIEMSGINRATVHDRLDVTGAVNLDGILHIVIDPGFFPTIGETITIMTHAARVGEFADVVVDGSVAFNVIYNDTNVQLLVTDADIAGDLDLDGDVDGNDHAVLVTCFEGPLGGDGLDDPCLRADLNGDGGIDLRDFQILQSVFTGN